VTAVDARAGALYLSGQDGVLRLEAEIGLGPDAAAAPGRVASFRSGEGLLGRAALSDDLVVVNDVPEDFIVLRSGLGASAPRELVLVPLSNGGRPLGVLELAFFSPCSDELRELLRLVRRTLVVAIEAARSRERLHALLEESQALAETLSVQEQELKRSNDELTSQQEELRVANEELAAQREELHRRNLELESTRERVQQKADELAKVSAYKSQFLANMSHELRTPLNSMLLLSQLLSENEARNLTDKQVEHLKTIHGAGEDLLELINGVLDLARIEAGRQDVRFESVELAQFVAFARRIFEPMAAQKGLVLRTELEPGLPETITTDHQRVERILTNLLANAIKFTDRGEVKLALRRAPADLLVPAATGSVIAFAVSDTGVGIPLDAQERVFSPFEQLEAHANRSYTGSGLGLAIARESAQLLGGDLRVESVPGKGSTFTCYLPPRPPGAEIERRVTAAPRAADDDRATLSAGELYLLVIEDDAVLAEQLVSIIHTRGLKARVTSSGEEGLKLARERKPVGIVLDVRLPDLDGWTVMERLRADPATRSIPVHFLSAVDSSERGLGLGAVGYLTKPVTHAELAGAVRALMVMPGGGPGRILVVEDDPDQRQSLVELLQSQEFDVCHADNARAAIQVVRSELIGCMILDLGLPDIDGLGLLREMRDDAQINAPRVLVHTGRMLSKAETRELEAYAEAVILKDERSLDRLLDEVRLFVHQVNTTPLPPKRPSQRPRSVPDQSLRGTKILLAEDDMRTVYALSAVLRGRGAMVVVADTGREALEALAHHPDVGCVLMDIMMPEMDGYEAMRRLRKDPRFAELPVIALTARAMKGERERCLEAGASDYLAKPVDGEQLVSVVSSWFKTREAASGSG
jgi:CheY-like chemotaxis protein